MTEHQASAPTRPGDGWVTFGMSVSAASAALTSFDGLRQLAVAAGWAEVMAPLLPLTVDAFAATATRVWLAKSTGSARARRFSRACAVGAILLSLAGNAVWHLIAADLLPVTWVIVLAVGAVPPCVLGLVSHLAVLRGQADTAEDDVSTVLSTVPKTVPEQAEAQVVPAKTAASARPRTASKRKATAARYSNEDQLLAAAQAADAAHRQAHGKGITRDQLRRTLGIGGERATAVLRRLKAESTDAQPKRRSFHNA